MADDRGARQPKLTIDNPVIEGAAAGAGAGSWLGPIGTIVGGAVGAGANFLSSRWSQNRGEKLANTAHQREVEDLKRAGLNPILSATRGAGADSPVTAPGEVSGLGTGVSSAARMATLEKQMLMSNIGLNTAAEAAKRQEVKASDRLTEEQVDFIRAQTNERRETAKSIKADREAADKFGKKLGGILPRDWLMGLDRFLRGIGGPNSAKER